MIKTVLYTVHGHVQSVGYRAFVQKHARILNISGYAKNNVDGTVSVYATGEEHNLSLFYHYLQQGPTRARVNKVVIEEQKTNPCNSDFKIR